MVTPGGNPQEVFECDYCLFDTYEEQEYNRHMLEVHQEAETEGWSLPGYDEQDFHDVKDWD